MPDISSLMGEELEQWTVGKPDVLYEILRDCFVFLKTATTEKKGEHYTVDGQNVASTYDAVQQNIFNVIGINGTKKITVDQGSGKPKLDGSALLGAYLRANIKDKDDNNIVTLSKSQVQAVHEFIAPLVPENFTAQQFFAGLKGTPQEQHKIILKLLIFQGLKPAEQASMSKDKYQKHVDTLLDAVLNLVDFMRTPFSVLNAEDSAMAYAAKKKGQDAKTSGIDLQWGSMLKAIDRSMVEVTELKKDKEQRTEAELTTGKINTLLTKCQGSFGVANTHYQMSNKLTEAANKQKQTSNELATAQQQNESLSTELAAATRQIAHLQNDLQTIQQDVQSLAQVFTKQHKEDLIKDQKILTELFQNLQQQLQNLENDKEQLQQQLNEKDALIEQLQTTKKAPQNDKLPSQQQTPEIELEVESAKAKELHLAQQELLTLKNEKAQLQQQVHEKNTRIEQLQTAQKAPLSAQLPLPQQAPEQELHVESAEAKELQRAQQELLTLKNENVQLQQQVHEKDTYIEQLQTEQKAPQSDKLPMQQPESAPLVEAAATQVALSNKQKSLLKDWKTLSKMALSDADSENILEQITNATKMDELAPIEKQLSSLLKMNTAVTAIIKGLQERDGFFSSPAVKKIDAIQKSFQSLSLEDKDALAKLNEKGLHERLKTTDKISDFLKTINQNRGLIALSSETTSFKEFKTHIKAMQKKDEPSAPEQDNSARL